MIDEPARSSCHLLLTQQVQAVQRRGSLNHAFDGGLGICAIIGPGLQRTRPALQFRFGTNGQDRSGKNKMCFPGKISQRGIDAVSGLALVEGDRNGQSVTAAYLRRQEIELWLGGWLKTVC